MKNYLDKLYAGIMLLIAAVLANNTIPAPGADQLQAGHIIFIVVLALVLGAGVVLIVLGARQKKREGNNEKRKIDKIQVGGIVTVCAVVVANAVLGALLQVFVGNSFDIVRAVAEIAGLALGVAMIVYGTRGKWFAGKGA